MPDENWVPIKTNINIYVYTYLVVSPGCWDNKYFKQFPRFPKTWETIENNAKLLLEDQEYTCTKSITRKRFTIPNVLSLKPPLLSLRMPHND